MTARRARAPATTPRMMEWSASAGARRNRTCPIARWMARRSAKRPRRRSVDVEKERLPIETVCATAAPSVFTRSVGARPTAGAWFALDSRQDNAIYDIVSRSYVTEAAATAARRGHGDVREQDQSPPDSPPGRAGPGTGLGGEGDDHAEAPRERPDRPPGAHRGGAEAGW